MYYVYILRCKNLSLYTGITTDPARRIREHSGEIAGGARYTSVFGTVKFEAIWRTDSRTPASKLEYWIKRLKKQEKEALIKNQRTLCELFSDKLDIEKYVRIDTEDIWV